MTKGIQQPINLPTLRCLPLLVKGTPIFLDILPFIAERPDALFQDQENPNLRPICYLHFPRKNQFILYLHEYAISYLT